jgi:formylglycine-generating enzyme required for sulfatase activity
MSSNKKSNNAQVVLDGLTSLATDASPEVRDRIRELGLEIVKLAETKPEAVLPEGWVDGGWYLDPATHMVWVAIPAGTFLYGPEKVKVTIEEPFYMARTPTTWDQYNAYCVKTGATKPEIPSFPIDGTHPVVNVSALDAQAFADYYGYAIPTEVQWEYCARGTDGREYPWGNEFDETKCVCRAQGTASVFDPRNTESPFGILGMAGNVWEVAYEVVR